MFRYVALAILITSPAYARTPSIHAMQRQYLALDAECRGGDHDPSDTVCQKRNRLIRQIERRGVCWGYRDMSVSPDRYDWHPCKKRRP